MSLFALPVTVEDLEQLQLGTEFVTTQGEASEASWEAAEINTTGTSETVFTYAARLLQNSISTSQVAIAVSALMEGTTVAVGDADTPNTLTSFSTVFLPPQIAYAVAHNLNPTVYAAEALGLALAGDASFNSNFVGLSESQFAEAVATLTGVNADPIQQWVDHWTTFYTSNPAAHLGLSVTQAAYGAAFGDAVGVALLNPTSAHLQTIVSTDPDFTYTPNMISGSVANALIDNAEGLYKSGVALGSLPPHYLLQGEAPFVAIPYVDIISSGIAQDAGANAASGMNQIAGFSYRAPPDNALAVGPDGIVTLENSAILISTPTTLAELSLADFFSSIPQKWTTIADPRAIYDEAHGQYIVVADAFNTDIHQTLFDGTNSILIAVSKDSDPTHGWYYQAVNTSYSILGHLTTADYPMIAVDSSDILISTVQLPAPISEDSAEDYFYASALTVVKDVFEGLGKGGQSSSQYQILDSTEAATAAQPAAYSTGGMFLVSSAFNDADDTILHYSYSKDSFLTLGVTDQIIDLGNIDFTEFHVGDRYPHLVPQPRTTVELDGGDTRITSTALANGHLYAVFEVTPSSSEVAAVHWVDIDVNDPTKPVLTDQGDISLPGEATFNPSIAVDGNGDLLINFTGASGSLMPTDYYTVRSAGSHHFTQPVAYQQSQASYEAHVAENPNIARWGDYSSAVADPSASNAFWISNEYVIGPHNWGTVTAHVVVPLLGISDDPHALLA